MNIHIANRYYPPNPAVTGEDACKLASRLAAGRPDVSVTVHFADAPYLGGGSRLESTGVLRPIRPLYKGRNKALRFAGNFIEGYLLASAAVKKADLMVSLTDPPLLNYWSGRICGRKRVPWIYWSFDIYPDAFAAARLVQKENLFYRHFAGAVKKNMPDYLIALGPGQAEFIRASYAKEVPFTVLPCGIHRDSASEVAPPWRRDDGRIYFAYAGNMGEAHSSRFLVDFVRCLDPDRHRCILALYGAKAGYVKRKVDDSEAVEFVSSISRSDLHYVDVHLVSLKPGWTHLCVPSKAVSAICASGALLVNGDESSDTWRMFKEAGWLLNRFGERSGRKDAIRMILEELTEPAVLQEKKARAAALREELYETERRAYEDILAFVQGKVG